MRIVHVVVSEAYAGVESHVARLARDQAAAGHSVVVVGGDVGRVGTTAGPDVRVLPGGSLAQARRGANANAGSADVVHAHMTAAEVVCCSLPAVLRGHVALVTTRHFARRRGESLLGRLARPLIARTVDAQIAISHFTADHVDGPATVVRSGVDDAPDGAPAREGVAETVRLPGAAGVVLMAQRLEPEKRTGDGVLAFAASGLADRGWRLLVAGDGAEREAVAELVASLGLRRSVDLLGHRSDVDQLLRQASLFLAPTPGEGLGLSVLEAMAHGVPVVADGSGGHRETLGADAPGLYATGDPQAAAEALRRLADSPDAARWYGQQLQVRQRELFSVARQVADTDAVYRAVLR
ncbi:MAG: glycosyltransferase family 4 protein [Promicromonosporaceae bacterium]|nr:glycosyltransferase family 4 protein [Promicromonosporaceae bacterium]